MPDAGVVAPHLLVLGARGHLCGFFLFIRMILASIQPAVLKGDGVADGATAFGVSKAGQGAGPGDVAVASRVQGISKGEIGRLWASMFYLRSSMPD